MSRPRPVAPEETDVFVDAVREGIADADAGRMVPYEDVRRWLASWGTEDELAPSSVASYKPVARK